MNPIITVKEKIEVANIAKSVRPETVSSAIWKELE